MEKGDANIVDEMRLVADGIFFILLGFAGQLSS